MSGSVWSPGSGVWSRANPERNPSIMRPQAPDPRPQTLGPALRLLVLALAAILPAHAETLEFVGVLGNSGEQGKALVRFSDKPARGIGVMCDRFGALWDRGGAGVLNRYTADGRLLGQYRIPDATSNSDQIALAGDTLVLLIGGRLHTLAVTAAPGSEAKPLNLEARCISFASYKGAIAAARGDEVILVDAATGAVTPVAKLKDVDFIELGDDGAVYPVAQRRMHRYVAGRQSDGWPREVNGDRPQLIDGRWYAHAWHGTIRRYDAGLDPTPGVVLGGASGSFIGHLDQNGELFNGRGMARVRDGLFALSGLGGVLQLATWHGDRQQLEIVRRIGPVQSCRGIGLDREGAVFHWCGAWDWSAGPDTPMRSGINTPEDLGQAVMLDNEVMVAPGYLWGKPAFLRGRLHTEVAIDRIEKDCALPRGTVGAAVWRDKDRLVLAAIEPGGKAFAFHIEADGRYRGELGEIALKTATPVKEWTALAMQSPDVLLAAGDGAVIEFARDGAGWQERKRWSSWGTGAEERFGARIHLACDGATLAVADGSRHRVLCFPSAGGKPRAAFGRVDAATAELDGLDSPATVAVRGHRVVVFDAANQRLVKLELAP